MNEFFTPKVLAAEGNEERVLQATVVTVEPADAADKSALYGP